MNKLLSLLALALPLLAGAQEVWRCGPDGRIYAQAPCADGHRVDVALAERPAADLQAARAQAARDERRTETMRSERLAQEAAQRGSGLAGIRTTAAAGRPNATAVRSKHRARPRPLRPAEDETWRAIAPASRRTKG